jgi:hypothetical protein
VSSEVRPTPRWSLEKHEYCRIRRRDVDSESMEAAGRWMFEEAREGGELTDMEFVFDTGRRIRGHKLWLIARSEYFRAMLSSGMREGSTGVMHVRECGEGAFLALLEFLYTGRLGERV